MIDFLWEHRLLLAFVAFVIGFAATIFVLQRGYVRIYRSTFSLWGVRRRLNGHLEINFGRWVVTTEPE